MGDVGPGADIGDALHQLIDVALGAVDARNLLRHPIGRQHAGPGRQIAVDLREKPRVGIGQRLAEIRDLADLPQQPQAVARTGETGQLRIARDCRQRQMIVGIAHADQPGRRRLPVETLQQTLQAAEIQIGIAPIERANGIEAMIFHRIHQLGIERTDFGRGAEGAVVHVAAGAAGDLRDLRSRQAARAAAVELGHAREGDMIQVHVQAHADGVGGDHVVHLARLVHLHLRIARARATGRP